MSHRPRGWVRCGLPFGWCLWSVFDLCLRACFCSRLRLCLRLCPRPYPRRIAFSRVCRDPLKRDRSRATPIKSRLQPVRERGLHRDCLFGFDIDCGGVVPAERPRAGRIRDDGRYVPAALKQRSAVDDVLDPIVRDRFHLSVPKAVSRHEVVGSEPVAAMFPLEVCCGRHCKHQRGRRVPRERQGRVACDPKRDGDERGQAENVPKRVPQPNPRGRTRERRLTERLDFACEVRPAARLKRRERTRSRRTRASQ